MLKATTDMEIQDCLSSIDAQRLQDIGVAFESNQGGLLAQAKDDSFNLAQPGSDGSIPERIFSFSRESIQRLKEAYNTYNGEQFVEKHTRKKVSATLSEYLWPSEQSDDRIEFRSPVPGFPPPGQLKVVSTYGRRKKGDGEYCLAACDDGTVRWLHESECVVNGNHVWTVHLFDLRGGGVVYFGDRLRRAEPHVYNHYEIRAYIGGNVNHGSGTQNIGTVNCC
ncbi:hypothetical protein RND81_10G223700 [Saponaria officinalis]|uniref:Uncharacterized protein n=1 Tax=Saponaria officinalis TaxID=3572 RepID=A0AAW1I5N0_SAPOF